MKKTLLVTLEYPPMIGGVAHYYKHVVEHLPADKIEVLDNSEGKLLSSSFVSRPRWLIGIWHTWRAVRKQNIEHILVGQILPIGTIALLLTFFFRTPYTVITHGMDITMPFAKGGSRRKQILIWAILANADSVIAASSFTKQALVAIGVAESRISIVHPCLSEESKTTVHSQDKQSTVLSVGRLVERKGFDRLIEAMTHVRQTVPDARLIIVGDGEDRSRLEQLTRRNDLHTVVTFTGKVDNAKLHELYDTASVFAMPSRQLQNGDVEGFGIVFLEAAQYGLPTIGGRSGGVPDAIEDGVTGYLVDPNDPQDIAKRIIKLLSDSKHAQKMGQAGRARVEKEFQWVQEVRKIEALLS